MADKVKKEAKPMPEHILAQRNKEREMVRGIFRFHEVPGGHMEFVFKKYKQDPLEKFSMRDGEAYTIPLGVARHLNTNCSYPTYNYRQDEAGRPIVSIAEKVRRCSFQSLEFVDIDDIPTALPKQ